MKFLANENFPLDAVDILRGAGHDVTWIRTHSPGAKDPVVLRHAISEQRVLLTFDKDFGELAFHAKLPASCGIVLFRIKARSSISLANAVLKAISSRVDWAGKFSVVQPTRIRVRPLPKP